MTHYITSLVADPTDARDYIFEWDSMALVPDRVDLRDYTGAIENQQAIGSCTANATVSACEMFLIANGEMIDTAETEPGDLSRLFNYYNSRHSVGGIYAEQDLGSYEREALRQARNQGLCPESVWPYVAAQWNTKPSDEAYAKGLERKLGAYYRITLTEPVTYKSTNPSGQIKYALAQGYPVLIGMFVGANIRTYKPGDRYSYVHPTNNPLIGGHEMLAVGYDGADVIMENSWGAGWGDRGYFRCPMNVLVNDAIDIWVIKGFAGFDRIGVDVTRPGGSKIVISAYNDMLHRNPEPAGLAHWSAMLAAGMSVADMHRAIAGSPEFLSIHTTVESLYRDILLREPDAGGLAGWKSSGLTISQIITGFVDSAEFSMKFA